ncbi:MAG: hypothetical protein H7A45_06575 [Verrucomicrobiales bacterium]|nr:hypothetical protein [Verrucomicrobiales bacterium]MCP5527590.1 hypothetical protein [Verrucomicrobiales bacterium]
MDWLKKNLMLVVAGLVALGLLGGAGWYLYSKYNRAAEVAAALDAQETELQRLINLKPHPGNNKIDNIKAAKLQEEEVAGVLQEARRTFDLITSPTNLTSGDFNALLLQTIDVLTRKAELSGVKLPPKYAFSFQNIKSQLAIDAKALPALAEQLAHIRAITEVLLEARPLTLDGIKRRAVAVQDTNTTTTTVGIPGPATAGAPGASSTQDYWDRLGSTNDVAILTPYEFTFHAFTPELAGFLEGLAESKYCFIPKNLVIDTAGTSLLASGMPTVDPIYGGMGGGAMGGGMAGRYGLAPGGGEAARYGLTPGMGMGRGPVTRGGKTIMLEEHPFRVRIWVYVVSPFPLDENGNPIKPAAPVPAPAAADPYADRYGAMGGAGSRGYP